MDSCIDNESGSQSSVPEGIEFSLHEEVVSELSAPSLVQGSPQRSHKDTLKCAKDVITACLLLWDKAQRDIYQRHSTCGISTNRMKKRQQLLTHLYDLLMDDDSSIHDKLSDFNIWWSFQVKVPINSTRSKSLFNQCIQLFSTDYFLEQVHRECRDIFLQAGISDVTTLLENNELQNYYFTPSIAVNPMRVSQSNSPA